MAFDPSALPDGVLAFLAERHLATLTTLRPDGSPHVVPVGFSYDAQQRFARVITDGASRKVAHAEAGGRAALCQLDRARWLTLEGVVRVVRDPEVVRAAERAYAGRYREPRVNPARVVLEIAVERILGTVPGPG